MTDRMARDAHVAEVIERSIAIGRSLRAGRRTPFHGRVLTGSQLDALFHLAHGPAPVTPGALATALAVTPGAVTQLVDGLRAEGLVESLPHPGDARSRVIRLSPNAAEQVADFERDMVARALPAFDGLQDAELETLASLLGRVGRVS
jgi:DNA-binding MarR family transcriptional regulator